MDGAPLVVVVDDNERGRKLVNDVLELRGYRTIAVDSAEAGIALAREHRPDLILMDIQFDGSMDGIDALRSLRADARTARIPVVALTANAMRGDEERLLAHGFDAYVAKPIDVRTLPRIVFGLLGRDSR